MKRILTVTTLVMLATAIGCAEAPKPKPVQIATEKTKVEVDEVATERAKLSAEDRAMVDAQEWCVIMDDERLGGMGPPVKLSLKGQTVFVCCKGCQKKAEANPDKALATLEELKAKKKQPSGAGK